MTDKTPRNACAFIVKSICATPQTTRRQCRLPNGRLSHFMAKFGLVICTLSRPQIIPPAGFVVSSRHFENEMTTGRKRQTSTQRQHDHRQRVFRVFYGPYGNGGRFTYKVFDRDFVFYRDFIVQPFIAH